MTPAATSHSEISLTSCAECAADAADNEKGRLTGPRGGSAGQRIRFDKALTWVATELGGSVAAAIRPRAMEVGYGLRQEVGLVQRPAKGEANAADTIRPIPAEVRTHVVCDRRL